MIKSVVSVALLVAVMLTFCACSNEKLMVMEEFSRVVSFQMDDVSVKGQLHYKNKDDITFTVIEPEILSGVIFTEAQAKKDEVSVNYSKLRDESPVYLLISAVKSMSESEIYLPVKGEHTFLGAVSTAEYKTKINCENNEIISIEIGKFTYIFE